MQKPCGIKIRALAALAACLICHAYAANAQEQTRGQNQVEQPAENTPKSLYYLGKKQQFKPQQGPALGKPLSIMPEPYMPPGSLDVEPLLEKMEAAASALVEESSAANQHALEQQEDLEGTVPGEVNPAEVGEEAAEQNIDAEEAGIDLPNAAETFLEAANLTQLDPSGLGVLAPQDSYAPDFWQGYSRAEIIELYKKLTDLPASVTLKAAIHKLALSGFQLPVPSGKNEIISFLEARLNVLAALGDREGYLAVLSRLPAGEDWSELAPYLNTAYLLDGRLVDACALAAQQRAATSDPYWIRVAAFCHASDANRQGVDFELEILSEISNVQPAFFQLIDRILLEAEQPAGSFVADAGALSSPLKVDVLEAAMARLSRSEVREVNLDDMNPLAAPLFLGLPGLAVDAKHALLLASQSRGILTSDNLVTFARALTLTKEEQAATFMPQENPDDHKRSMQLLHMVSSAPYETDKFLAMRELWSLARSQKNMGPVSAAVLELAGNQIDANASDYPLSLIMRANLLAGRDRDAKGLLMHYRALPAGSNAQADSALTGYVPLALMAGHGFELNSAEVLLDLWWQAQGEDNRERFEQANLLFSLLEGLNYRVPERLWDALEAGPSRSSLSAVSPAHWRRFLKASAEKDAPRILTRLVELMQPDGVYAMPAALSGSLVAHMRTNGFEAEARKLALEIAIARGL